MKSDTLSRKLLNQLFIKAKIVWTEIRLIRLGLHTRSHIYEKAHYHTKYVSTTDLRCFIATPLHVKKSCVVWLHDRIRIVIVRVMCDWNPIVINQNYNIIMCVINKPILFVKKKVVAICNFNLHRHVSECACVSFGDSLCMPKTIETFVRV